MKKKLIGILLIVATIATCTLAFTACGKDSDKGSYTPLTAQANIFTELNAKTADAGIMDYTMANYLLKQNTSFANSLMIADIELESEQYGIATRKAAAGKYSKLDDEINKALKELKKNGTYASILADYGCAGNAEALAYTAPSGTADTTEYDKVVNAGKIVIGFTLNAPMAIGEGSTITGGIDFELANAVFAYINTQNSTNITVEWKLIEWGNKETEMSAKTIDCIWNGMTITEERQTMWAVSNPYLTNKQCVVIRKSDSSKYTTADSLKTALIVAESGSAGEDAAKAILGIND